MNGTRLGMRNQLTEDGHYPEEQISKLLGSIQTQQNKCQVKWHVRHNGLSISHLWVHPLYMYCAFMIPRNS